MKEKKNQKEKKKNKIIFLKKYNAFTGSLPGHFFWLPS